MSSRAMKKSFLRVLLETEILGRLSRKFSWIGMKVFAKIAGRFHHIHSNLPYVKKIDRVLRPKRLQSLTKYYNHLGHVVNEMPYQPKISILIPVYKVMPSYFWECLQSVAIQVYKNWELCIVDDCSNDPAINKIVEEFQARFPGQVHFLTNEVNSHISITSNNCLKLARGEYIGLLDHDDRLYPNSLSEVVRYINFKEKPDILYSDERTIDEHGNKLNDSYRKPDWSPFMHLCMNYTTHFSVYKRELIVNIGGFRKGFEGSQDHDLMLRAVEASSKPVVHIPFCLYQWRAHPLSTAASMSSKPYAAIAGEKAVTEALARRGRPAVVNYEPFTHHYRLDFALPSPLPLISIVIPNKNSFELLQHCLEAVFQKSTYPHIEVIVIDNGSTDERVLALYKEYEAKNKNFISFVEHAYFNFGKMVNQGVSRSHGDYVLLLNNDTSVIEPSWIEEMLKVAQFPEIAAVGAKLLYPNGTVQHAGILLTGQRIAEHPGIGLPEAHALYCNVMNTLHESSAISAACMLIRKDKYLEVGGFDEKYLPNGYGDVEFCLKLSRKGYSHLFTPYARLYHHESPSRGGTVEYFERFYLMQEYGREVFNDPFLNPNIARGNTYDVDHGYEGLDLTAPEFQYFLKN